MNTQQLIQKIEGWVNQGYSPQQVRAALMGLNPVPTGFQVQCAISNISEKDFAKRFFRMMNPYARV